MSSSWFQGGINEDILQAMTKARAPIDGCGVGVNLAASIDVPALDCAYKLQEYAGTPRRKLSEGKQTWPGRKQVWRATDADGRMHGDILSVETDSQVGETLIVPVMRGGKRVGTCPNAGGHPRPRRARIGAAARAAAAARGLRLSGDGFRRPSRARRRRGSAHGKPLAA